MPMILAEQVLTLTRSSRRLWTWKDAPESIMSLFRDLLVVLERLDLVWGTLLNVNALATAGGMGSWSIFAVR